MIEAEQLRTRGANNWLDCLATKMSAVETWLDLATRRGRVSAGETEKYQVRLEQLKLKIRDERTEFPEGDPTLEVKQELLAELNIFADPKQIEQE